MNKADLKKAVAAKTGWTQDESEQAIDGVFDCIVEALESGEEKVEITGTIRFYTKKRKGGKKRNPQTGAEVITQDKNVVATKLLKRLKEAKV